MWRTRSIPDRHRVRCRVRHRGENAACAPEPRRAASCGAKSALRVWAESAPPGTTESWTTLARLVCSGWRSVSSARFSSPRALVAIRDEVEGANLALILVLVVVLAAITGGWQAGAVAGVTSALAFDFFLTRPYLSLTIDSQDDVETAILLLIVGVSVGFLAGRARVAVAAARRGSSEIERIHRVAELAAQGARSEDVLLESQTQLTRAPPAQGVPVRSSALRCAARADRAQRNCYRHIDPTLRTTVSSSSRAKASRCPSSHAASRSGGLSRPGARRRCVARIPSGCRRDRRPGRCCADVTGARLTRLHGLLPLPRQWFAHRARG